jgi:hypothetical protein
MNNSYTHAILHPDSGEPIGAVRDVDELATGERFGIARYFALAAAPTYIWLGGLHVLPLAEASTEVRRVVAAVTNGT